MTPDGSSTGTVPSIVEINGHEYAADRVVVVLNRGASVAAVSAAPFVQSVRSLGFDIYRVQLTPGTDLSAAVTVLGGAAGVEGAEMDEIRHATRVPNDPGYSSLFGPNLIGAETVWNTTTGDPNFVVGVIDSGIDYTHPDLAANIWTNPGEIPGNGVDDDGNGYVDDVHGYDFANLDSDPIDDFVGHGTHVAGTIGAVGNNGIGVTGVNWNVKLMALNFLGVGPFSGSISAEVEAIHYSVMMGVKVTNNSYGGYGTSRAEARAIAETMFAGQIYVAAAGNDAVNNDLFNPFPAYYSTSFDNVVTVAAIDSADQLADFSNFGPRSVTIAAPGVAVNSTYPIALDVPDPFDPYMDSVQDGYRLLDGTSMASPHVAGAIALYWSANPTLTYKEVIHKLLSSVDVLPQLSGFVSSSGRLNVAKMFEASPVAPVVVGAPAGSDIVRVLGPNGETQQTLTPHPGFLGGIVAATGDVTGDGVADIVTAATFGGHVKVFDGVTGAELRSFYGFQGYLGPINLAVGDMNNDGIGDIIIAANLNGHIKVFDGPTGDLTFSSLVYQGYTGAIAVATADIDGDGQNELLTAADSGKGIHVKEFRPGSMTLRDSFYATTGTSAWSNFSLAAADMDYDGIAELLVSQGPRVRVVDARTKAVRADFLAFDPRSQDPIRVQAGRVTGDPTAELVVIDENQGRSHVKVFTGLNYTLYDSFYAGTR